MRHGTFTVTSRPLPRDQRCGHCQLWALELLTVSGPPHGDVVFTGCARCWGEALLKEVMAHGVPVLLEPRRSLSKEWRS